MDPKDTVDKLNKSKLTGNVNVNKMVLPWVTCWWWNCCFCLAENANNQPSQSVVMAGGGWRQERHRLNSSTSLSQPCLPTNHHPFFADNLSAKAAGNKSIDGCMTACDDEIGWRTTTQQPTNKRRRGSGAAVAAALQRDSTV